MTATLPVRPATRQPVLAFPDGPGEPWEFTSSDGIAITPEVAPASRLAPGMYVRVRGNDILIDQETLRAIDELRQALRAGR